VTDYTESLRHEHQRALRAAYSLAESAALHRLRGEPFRRYDARGLDPYSEEWGRVAVLETLHPTLSALRDSDPVEMRTAAERSARATLAEQLLAEFPGHRAP
jgi:hypothetical protein